MKKRAQHLKQAVRAKPEPNSFPTFDGGKILVSAAEMKAAIYAMSEDEIVREASIRQDDMETGVVTPLDYGGLVAGIRHRPRNRTS